MEGASCQLMQGPGHAQARSREEKSVRFPENVPMPTFSAGTLRHIPEDELDRPAGGFRLRQLEAVAQRMAPGSGPGLATAPACDPLTLARSCCSVRYQAA